MRHHGQRQSRNLAPGTGHVTWFAPSLTAPAPTSALGRFEFGPGYAQGARNEQSLDATGGPDAWRQADSRQRLLVLEKISYVGQQSELPKRSCKPTRWTRMGFSPGSPGFVVTA